MSTSERLEARGWKLLANESAGKPYGHVPGHQFHDVDVTIRRRGAAFRVEIVEKWGSAQGYDEVHGRKQIVAIEDDLDRAVRIASSRAQDAAMTKGYLVEALSCAHAEAVDAIAEAEAEGKAKPESA